MENDRELIVREIRDMWTDGLEAKKGSERYFQISSEIERITSNEDLKQLEYFLLLARLFYQEEIIGKKNGK